MEQKDNLSDATVDQPQTFVFQFMAFWRFFHELESEKKPRSWKIPLAADEISIVFPKGYTRISKLIRLDFLLVRPGLAE